MNKHQCRRKKSIDVNDEREVVKNVIVFDASKNYSLFEDCKSCGYGRKAWILKTREPPFETYEIKTCILRQVVRRENE